jgi:hypothetical protein
LHRLSLFSRVTLVLNRLLRRFVQCAEAPSKPDLRQPPIHRLPIKPRRIDSVAAPGRVVLVLHVPWIGDGRQESDARRAD